jgi:Ran GTPase-activating protein (RanGAP) involved in mRNA processing and transport
MARLFKSFRGLRNLTLVYGDPRKNFAKYEEFDAFTIDDDMSPSVKECMQLRDDFKSIGSFCALESFEMSDNSLSDKCAQIIGFGLVYLKRLTTLNFSHNEIGNKGFNNLVQCCRSSPIKYIDVSDNKIGGTGAQSLASALEKNTTIEEINLSSNKLRDKGMFAISMILEKTTSLKKLDISGNRIEHIGNLCEVIVKNKTLKNFSIAANPICVEDLTQLNDTMISIKNQDPYRFEEVDLRTYPTNEEDYLVKTTETSENPLLRIKGTL